MLKSRNSIKKFLPSFGVFMILLSSSLLFNAECTKNNESNENVYSNTFQSIEVLGGGKLNNHKCDSAIRIESSTNFEEHYIYLNVLPIGCIAVNIRIPKTPRYEDELAPLILSTPVFFTPPSYGPLFSSESPNFYNLGAIELGLILPSRCVKPIKGDGLEVCSEGSRDRGGKESQAAMFAVFKYMLGDKMDSDDFFINERFSVADVSNVGAFAFSHPGMLLNTTMARYGKQLTGVSYVVMRENPTQPMFASVELGDVLSGYGCNSLYDYSKYNSNYINIDYSSISWNSTENLPYFDIDGNGSYDSEYDFSLYSRIPQLIEEGGSSKNLYSLELLKNLKLSMGSNYSLLKDILVSIEEANDFWQGRTTLGEDFNGNSFNAYSGISANHPGLKQMLIFGKSQHVQNCRDAPSVHQAYDGYTLNAMWSRLNPDDAYIAEIVGSPTFGYREIPANFIANSWKNGADFGYDSYQASTVVQAAVLEMMDRTHQNIWKDDLDNVLYK